MFCLELESALHEGTGKILWGRMGQIQIQNPTIEFKATTVECRGRSWMWLCSTANFPTKFTPAAFVSLFNLHIPQKLRRGNGNQEFQSHLGDTEPGPCCHQWPKVTSASHNIFAPPSLSLKQTNPIPKESRSLPAREHHPAGGSGVWVEVSFQSPRLGHTVPSSHGFRVTCTWSSLSWIFFLAVFPTAGWGKGKLNAEEAGTRSRSGAASGCSAAAALLRRRSKSRLGSSGYFWE